MKFIALISGGKDSCYNAIKCIELGHELICIGNLSPPEGFIGEELNSFMYQSAAHGIIPSQQLCFDVPMIRREINGSAIDKSLGFDIAYHNMCEDEVEDLYGLLKVAIEEYPTIRGVSCGAIVSTYQRLRLECVCNRLNLTPLCFLWQIDRLKLLDEIIDCGKVNAIIVKVAGAGLDPTKHLGQSLQTLRPSLLRLHEKYGLDVCGEGGEYESLVVDCPLFKRRLVIHNWEIVLDEEGDHSVGNLKVLSHSVDDKLPHEIFSIEKRLPRRDIILGAKSFIENNCNMDSPITEKKPSSTRLLALTNIEAKGEVISRRPVINIHPHSGIGQTSLILPAIIGMSEIAAQVDSCIEQLEALLRQYNLAVQDTIFIHLYISSIDHFAAVNDAYCRWFGRYPPSRSCVAVLLPDGVNVSLDAMVYRYSYASISDPSKKKRSVLHVQSMSDWAPLCIGPYAQANTIDDAFVFVAGQIPLDPATMQIIQVEDCNSAFEQIESSERWLYLLFYQLWLAVRNALRVVAVLDDKISTILFCTVYLNASLLPIGAFLDRKLEENLQRIINAMIRNYVSSSSNDSNDTVDAAGEEVERWDEEDNENSSAKQACPVLVVGVSGIPRDALVEVELLAFRGSVLPSAMISVGMWCTEATDLQADIDINGRYSLIREVLRWPLWTAKGSDSKQEVVSTVFSEIHQHNAMTSKDLSMVSICSRVLRCFSIGFLQINRNSSSEDMIADDELEAQLARCIQRELDVAQLLPENILVVRVYSFRAQSESKLQSLLGASFSVVHLVVPILPEFCITAAQYVMVDLCQVKTENWIHT